MSSSTRSATEARVKLQLEPDKFILTVADNGRGLGDLSGKAIAERPEKHAQAAGRRAR